MNQDMMINHLAHIIGKPRKEVIATLKKMSQMPEVKKFLKIKHTLFFFSIDTAKIYGIL